MVMLPLLLSKAVKRGTALTTAEPSVTSAAPFIPLNGGERMQPLPHVPPASPLPFFLLLLLSGAISVSLRELGADGVK